ncbi:MAG: GHKL domain-containing protein [Eubacteriales bacterium]|nr:GHKL domain-containing protein [Eubacteriales bacterium]
MIILLVFMLLIIGTFFLAKKSVELQNAEMENQVQKNYLEDMEQLYDQIREKAWQNRKYRHDLERHIRTLEALLEEKRDDPDMNDYQENLKDTYRKMKNQKFCQDEIVNTVLKVKEEQCNKKNFPFQIQVMDCEYGEIKEIDLIAMLENLLDNAMEAQERLNEDPWIGLKMEKNEREVTITVENRILPGETVSFQTKKADHRNHGVGMRILDEIVSNYHGTKKVTVDPEKHLLGIEVKLKLIV